MSAQPGDDRSRWQASIMQGRELAAHGKYDSTTSLQLQKLTSAAGGAMLCAPRQRED